MLKPLGLPPGSVRALLLLGLAATVILDLRHGLDLEPWLVAALGIAAVAYFSHRTAAPKTAAPPGTADLPRRRPPWGLPAGTIRTIFLALVAYGVYLWAQAHGIEQANVPVGWVLAAYVLGVLLRAALWRMQQATEDEGTHWFWHLQALVALIAVGGLITFSVTGRPDLPTWVEPFLAAIVVYYFGTR